MRPQHLRVARATHNLEAIVCFYTGVLAFEVVGRFDAHDGFDGVMLGHPDAGWHLEFTQEPARDNEAATSPSPEDLLVLYYRSSDYAAAAERAAANGCQPVPSYNPYWDGHGMTIEDPDGYRIVLHRGPWAE